MSIHPPHSTPASSRLSPPFPPYLRIASRLFPPPATGAPPASAAVRFLRIGSHLIAIPVATLAVFAATFAVFAAHCQRQFQQTRLNSRIERRTRPMRIEKRQKRQCSPIQSTLPAAITRDRGPRPRSPLGVAQSSAYFQDATAYEDTRRQIRRSWRRTRISPEAQSTTNAVEVAWHGLSGRTSAAMEVTEWQSCEEVGVPRRHGR